MSNAQTIELNKILTLLNELDINNTFEVFIPSLQKEIKFKQLTTEQLKRILKTLIDTPLYNTEFNLTFNSIIKENCQDGTVNINELTVFDKQIILLKMRTESISSTYTFEVDSEKIEIDLAKKITDFLQDKKTFKEEIFTNDNCSITCNLPTIETENKFEFELKKNLKPSINTPDDLRNLIGETFINEITKFITSITIGEQTNTLTSYNFKDRVKVVEKLPVTLINNVVKYIENYRKATKQLLIFSITLKSGTVITKELLVDASFFSP